jgi:hypothetical protein
MTFVTHLNTQISHDIFLKDEITKLQLHDVVYNLKAQQASHTSIKGYNFTAILLKPSEWEVARRMQMKRKRVTIEQIQG